MSNLDKDVPNSNNEQSNNSTNDTSCLSQENDTSMDTTTTTTTDSDKNTQEAQQTIIKKDQPLENKDSLHQSSMKDENSQEQLFQQIQTTISKDQQWLYPQFIKNPMNHSKYRIRKPDEFQDEIKSPLPLIDKEDPIFDRIKGSIFGLAMGDALGAHVEFRPHSFLKEKPVKKLEGGGTWGLQKGQFTDDTSMALCLATSLIVSKGFSEYDQLVRYKWWYEYGFLSSTGDCFDIGNATRESILEFEQRQLKLSKTNQNDLHLDFIDRSSDIVKNFNVFCSSEGVAGNGALMRLGPVPLYFHKNPKNGIEYSGKSGLITHGDPCVSDACRYYGALIIEAIHQKRKDELLSEDIFSSHEDYFSLSDLHPDISSIAKGSFKNPNGYEGGIRGGGFIVRALEAALWAFWSTNNFQDGVLAAVNLGDDTDTTAAIYGQLAGAFYGYKALPDWKDEIYAKIFLEKISEWIYFESNNEKGTNIQESSNNDSMQNEDKSSISTGNEIQHEENQSLNNQNKNQENQESTTNEKDNNQSPDQSL